MNHRPYLDYYGEKNIIPVRQDLSDLDRHFRRRAALYRSLGLVPAWLKGKRVIEFGPGSGDNAVYTASLEPSLYTLFDGNPASIEALRNKEAEGVLRNVEIVQGDLIEYEDDRRYDLVLCEGLIPWQTASARYLRHVAGFAAAGGVVVTTTTSSVSFFPEICRRMVKPVFVGRTENNQELLSRLVSFFEPHLKTLPGMSRHPEDWVLDVIFHPCAKSYFSMPEAIQAMAGEFEIQGTSPQFLTDWRWYKDVHEQDTGRNALAISRYREYFPAFLDYRVDPATIGPCDNAGLEKRCDRANSLHRRIWTEDNTEGMPEFLGLVEEVAECVATAMPRTAGSLRAYIGGMRQLMDGNDQPDFGDFFSHFGRGMKYASFVRRP